MKKCKTAQSWSIDLIIGVIIFMLIIAIFYAFISSRKEPPIEQLQNDARAIESRVDDQIQTEDIGLINGGVINETKLQELCQMQYDEVKQALGIEHDFCIYIEDQEGNIIPCPNNRIGIGNAKDIKLSQDFSCGEYGS